MTRPTLSTNVLPDSRTITPRRKRTSRQQRFRIEELEGRQLLAVLAVQNPADSGQGTLRDAIQQANANPAYTEIILDLEGKIDLTSPLPTLTGNYKIDGTGANHLTIERNGGPEFRIFTVAQNAHIEIDDVTIAEGVAPENSPGVSFGGGIDNEGSLVLNGVELFHNSAIDFGGGLYNHGKATVTNSTLDRNVVTAGFGAAYYGENGSQAYFANSTIALNYAAGANTTTGGLAFDYAANGTLADCTVDQNYSEYGAAGTPGQATGAGLRVFFDGSGNHGDVQLYDTLIANNVAGTANTPDDVYGPIDYASRYNLIGDGDAAWGIADKNGGNKVGTAGNNGSHYIINLGDLVYNGTGETRTNALLLGSDAIDAGSTDYSDPQTTDQNGLNRVVNNQIDIGAYEYQPSGVSIQLVSSPSAAPGQTVTLTALVNAVTPGSNPITGIVTFYYNDYDPGTFLAQVPVINGKAVLSNVTIPANATLVAAQYEGSSLFSGTNTEIDFPPSTPGNGGMHGSGGPTGGMHVTEGIIGATPAAAGGMTGTVTAQTGSNGTAATTPSGNNTPGATPTGVAATVPGSSGQTQTMVFTKGLHHTKISHLVVHGHAHPGKRH